MPQGNKVEKDIRDAIIRGFAINEARELLMGKSVDYRNGFDDGVTWFRKHLNQLLEKHNGGK